MAVKGNCPSCNSFIAFSMKYKSHESDTNQVIRYFTCKVCNKEFELDELSNSDYRYLLKLKKRAQKIVRTNRLRNHD